MLPEIRAYMAKARLKRGIEMVKLANRIESLRMQEDEEEGTPQSADVPAAAVETAGQVLAEQDGKPLEQGGLKPPEDRPELARQRSLSKLAKSAIFREVVLAKVRDIKADEEAKKVATGAAPPQPPHGKTT